MTEKHKKFLKTVESDSYIFHIHTNFTDGTSSVKEYHDAFKNFSLIFTEHIRKNPSYNWKAFIQEVKKYGHLVGFEAKILPKGDIDIPIDALEKIDVLAVAVHSYKDAPETLPEALRKVFSTFADMIPLVWVHPFSSPSEKLLNTSKMNYIEIVMKGFEKSLYIEWNVKKKNFTPQEVSILKQKYKLIVGYDAHSVDELKRMVQSYRTLSS